MWHGFCRDLHNQSSTVDCWTLGVSTPNGSSFQGPIMNPLPPAANLRSISIMERPPGCNGYFDTARKVPRLMRKQGLPGIPRLAAVAGQRRAIYQPKTRSTVINHANGFSTLSPPLSFQA